MSRPLMIAILLLPLPSLGGEAPRSLAAPPPLRPATAVPQFRPGLALPEPERQGLSGLVLPAGPGMRLRADGMVEPRGRGVTGFLRLELDF